VQEEKWVMGKWETTTKIAALYDILSETDLACSYGPRFCTLCSTLQMFISFFSRTTGSQLPDLGHTAQQLCAIYCFHACVTFTFSALTLLAGR